MKRAAIVLALALSGCATTAPQPHPMAGQIILVSPWHVGHVAGCARCQIWEVGR